MEQTRESRSRPAHICQLIFDKDAEIIHWRNSYFKRMVLEQIYIYKEEEMNSHPCLTAYAKIYPK